MNIQVDPTNSNLASAMFNSKIRPRAVVGYGVKIFHPTLPNYVTRSPGRVKTANQVTTKEIKLLRQKWASVENWSELTMMMIMRMRMRILVTISLVSIQVR